MSKESDDGCFPRMGCSSLLGVLTVGLGLSFFSVAIGGSCSVRVPLTEANITSAGSIGAKSLTKKALPNYVMEKVAGNENFINNSTTLTVGPAESIAVFVAGNQPGSPAVDLNLFLATQDSKRFFHFSD